MATVGLTRNTTLPNSSAKSDFHNLVDTATGSVSNIVNADVDSAAAIASTKLDLSAVAQKIVMSSKAIDMAKGSDIASASSIDLGAATGNFVDVTGTTGITSLGTVQSGTFRIVRFTGALILTHNATSLILPTSANITTVNGDCAGFESLGSGNWKCVFYQRQDGTALVTASSATQSEMEAASSTTVYASPGRVQYHPGVAKAWCEFNGTGTPAMVVSHNMDSSITDNGAGTWTVSFTTDFSSTGYACIVTHIDDDGSTPSYGQSAYYSKATGSITILAGNNSGSFVDVSSISVVAFGDQA